MGLARIEILKMISDGRISPEDGERLLNALGQETASNGPTAGSYEDSNGKTQTAAENIGKAFEDAGLAIKTAATEGVRAVQRVFDEHRPGTEPVALVHGAFEVPEGSQLRIHPAFRVSMGGGSVGGAVTLRGVGGTKVRVVEGSAVEVHKCENEFVLSWAKSSLELELPATLSALFVRGLGGNVSLIDYPGEFRVESLGGNLSVGEAKSPFHVSTVGGSIRIHQLQLTSGNSSIRATGGDITILDSQGASVEIQATTALGGSLELPEGASIASGRTRHRGSCVLGEGTAALKIDSTAGKIQVQTNSTETTVPSSNESSVRDAAGEVMADFDTVDDDPMVPPPPGTRRPDDTQEVAGGSE